MDIYKFLIFQAWTYGPDMSIAIKAGAVVQFGNSFIVVGGQGSSEVDSIHQFDAEQEKWILRNEKLNIARYETTAFLVPDSYCTPS